MLVFFSDDSTVKKIEDLCKVTGETQSKFIEDAVLNYLNSDQVVKAFNAKSSLTKHQLESVNKLKSTSKVAALMYFLDQIDQKDVKERYKKIISMRFGLFDHKSSTLEEIGNEFGITRERVRQIIAKLLTNPSDQQIIKLIDNSSEIDLEDELFSEQLIKTAEKEIEDEIQKIISTTASYFSFTPDNIFVKKRTADVAFVRQLCMYALKDTLDLSFSRIGRIFKRDHTTVMYAIDTIRKKIAENPELAEVYEQLKPKLLKDDSSKPADPSDIYEVVLISKDSGNRIHI